MKLEVTNREGENMKFKDWFKRNLKEYKKDIQNYGCEAGFPHITYTSDCVKLYDRLNNYW
jgi:hypothetical protein